MLFNDAHVVPNASQIRVTTGLLGCDKASLNLGQIMVNLEHVYRNALSSKLSHLHWNVSSTNLNCSPTGHTSFEQLILFSQSISIRIQILFASVYFDYVASHHYRLGSFAIDRDKSINLSSITLNDSAQSDACSSVNFANDPFCSMNLTHPVCRKLSNPWNFICSQKFINNTISFFDSKSIKNDSPAGTAGSSSMSSWQIGLICGFSVLAVLLLLLLAGYFCRRYAHSKHLTLSRLNLFSDTPSIPKGSVTAQGQLFTHNTHAEQPARCHPTASSPMAGVSGPCIHQQQKNAMNMKSVDCSHQVTYVNQGVIPDLGLTSNIASNFVTSMYVDPNHRSPSKPSPAVFQTFKIPSRSIIGQMQRDELNGTGDLSSDLSGLHRSTTTPRSVVRQLVNESFVDEELADEDAWMPILDIVKAELAKLNEEDRRDAIIQRY